MNEHNNREIKALFESAYEQSAPSKDFVRSTLEQRSVQRHRHVMFAMAAMALLGFLTFSSVREPIAPAAPTDEWTTDFRDVYDAYDEYRTSLLEEPEGLDELPTEAYAYIQLIEDQFEEN